MRDGSRRVAGQKVKRMVALLAVVVGPALVAACAPTPPPPPAPVQAAPPPPPAPVPRARG